MKHHLYKIKDQNPHRLEETRYYGLAIFWASFALIVSSLGILANWKNETQIIPLLLGLSALGLIHSFKSLKS